MKKGRKIRGKDHLGQIMLNGGGREERKEKRKEGWKERRKDNLVHIIVNGGRKEEGNIRSVNEGRKEGSRRKVERVF